jgi:hypothetical protein
MVPEQEALRQSTEQPQEAAQEIGALHEFLLQVTEQ